jgi:hypothetical protein
MQLIVLIGLVSSWCTQLQGGGVSRQFFLKLSSSFDVMSLLVVGTVHILSQLEDIKDISD